MNREIGLSNAEFGATAGLLFVGYYLVEMPRNLALFASVWGGGGGVVDVAVAERDQGDVTSERMR